MLFGPWGIHFYLLHETRRENKRDLFGVSCGFWQPRLSQSLCTPTCCWSEWGFLVPFPCSWAGLRSSISCRTNSGSFGWELWHRKGLQHKFFCLDTFNSGAFGGRAERGACSVLWNTSQMLREWKPTMDALREDGRWWFMGTNSNVSKLCAQPWGAGNPRDVWHDPSTRCKWGDFQEPGFKEVSKL